MTARVVRLAAVVASAAACVTVPCAAIESQALATVERLPVELAQAFACGRWADASGRGAYRVVVVDVNDGAGSEVYVQRVRDADATTGRSQRLVDTTAVRELNDDHAQYRVVSARCAGTRPTAVVELTATFEHDERDIRHRIRVRLDAPGRYRVTGAAR